MTILLKEFGNREELVEAVKITKENIPSVIKMLVEEGEYNFTVRNSKKLGGMTSEIEVQFNNMSGKDKLVEGDYAVFFPNVFGSSLKVMSSEDFESNYLPIEP